MAFSFGPNGVTGGSKNDVNGDWVQVYSGSPSLSTTATTLFSHLNPDSTADAVLSTGIYLVRVYLYNAGWYSETNSGIMQWYGSETNSNNVNDIYLTGAGHAPNNQVVYARVKRNGRSANVDLSFQVWTNNSTAEATACAVYVKRIG